MGVSDKPSSARLRLLELLCVVAALLSKCEIKISSTQLGHLNVQTATIGGQFDQTRR